MELQTVGLIILGIFFYIAPSLVARNNKNRMQVIAINLLLGWTFIGWIVALVMSLKNED